MLGWESSRAESASERARDDGDGGAVLRIRVFSVEILSPYLFCFYILLGDDHGNVRVLYASTSAA
jgi:hypothetical protein